jgi:hypothetical protein
MSVALWWLLVILIVVTLFFVTVAIFMATYNYSLPKLFTSVSSETNVKSLSYIESIVIVLFISTVGSLIFKPSTLEMTLKFLNNM